MSKESPQNINQFLTQQLQNTIKLLGQNTTIGNTHVLYPATIVDAVLQTLNNIGATLQQNNNPTTTPPPVKNQKPLTKQTVDVKPAKAPNTK